MTYQERQLQLFEHLEQQFRKGKNPVTLVPSMTDYAADHRICLTSVVLLPETLQNRIQKTIIEPLHSADPQQYYYVPKSLHLTIQNVRAVAEPPNFRQHDAEKVATAFQEVIPHYPSFSFELKRLFELPASISVCGFSDAILGQLVRELRNKLIDISVPDDKIYASQDVMFGNVSVCRFVHKPNIRFFEIINTLKHVEIGTLEVKKISLITTNAVCRPERTTVLTTFSLQ